MSAFKKSGDPLPKNMLDSIHKTKLALKAPLETPIGEGFRSANVRLREEFKLYANVRPAISFIHDRRKTDKIDLVLIRENTEKCVSYRARLKNSENFLTLHLSGRKQTTHTQLLDELVERIITEEVFFCDENVRIRPTENNGSVDDVYKILLSDQVRVRVMFYTVAELECLCSSGSGQDSTSEVSLVTIE